MGHFVTSVYENQAQMPHLKNYNDFKDLIDVYKYKNGDDPDNNSSDNSKLWLVLLIISAIVVILVIFLVVLCCCRYRSKKFRTGSKKLQGSELEPKQFYNQPQKEFTMERQELVYQSPRNISQNQNAPLLKKEEHKNSIFVPPGEELMENERKIQLIDDYYKN